MKWMCLSCSPEVGYRFGRCTFEPVQLGTRNKNTLGQKHPNLQVVSSSERIRTRSSAATLPVHYLVLGGPRFDVSPTMLGVGAGLLLCAAGSGSGVNVNLTLYHLNPANCTDHGGHEPASNSFLAPHCHCFLDVPASVLCSAPPTPARRPRGEPAGSPACAPLRPAIAPLQTRSRRQR